MHNLILEMKTRNAIAKAFSKLCDGGYIRILTEDNIILSELKLSKVAFKDPSKGVLIANDIEMDIAVRNSGKASKYEIYMQDGKTKILTGTVGLLNTNSDLELPTLDLVEGSQLQIESYKHIVSK